MTWPSMQIIHTFSEPGPLHRKGSPPITYILCIVKVVIIFLVALSFTLPKILSKLCGAATLQHVKDIAHRIDSSMRTFHPKWLQYRDFYLRCPCPPPCLLNGYLKIIGLMWALKAELMLWPDPILICVPVLHTH